MRADPARFIPVIEELPWDTEFFGFRIGRVVGPRPTEEEVAAAVGQGRERGIVCLYLNCPANAGGTVTAAARAGFRVVGIRLTLESRRPAALSAAAVRRTEARDLPALGSLARSAFVDSRFFVDERFPRRRVEDLYERWVERDTGSPEGVSVVAERDGKVAGFATGLLGRDEGAQVGLVAVAPVFRGRGVGREVVQGVVAGLAERGARSVSVVTQGGNCEAIRLYEEIGFRASSVEVSLHGWLDEDPV
jgi:dTDP-4-amino-4,6-dideoxy-D-galactose acyltransferase